MRAHLVVIFALVWLVEIHPTLGRAPAGPQTMSDVVVVMDETTNQSTTYIADETSGAIYSLARPAANALAPSELKLTDFGEFFRSPELSRPAGIAYYNGKLVVCDRRLAAVFEIDTTTRTLSLLLKGDPLRQPTRVAVSPQSGHVAVSNNSGEIILYDRSSKLVTVKRRFDSPVRLAFAGEDLLVLENQGTILSVQAKPLKTGSPMVSRVEMPAKVGNDMAKIIDFAFLNGVYYVMGEKQVDAYIRSKGTAIQLFSQPMDSVSLSGIAANKQSIVLSDARNNMLWQMERPVPVTASFGKGSLQSLIGLYEYLLTRKSLPIRKFIAPHDYKSLEQLLLDQKIIFGEPSPATDELVKFVCRLNGRFCVSSPSPDFSSTNQSIRKGQSLNLPDLSYTEIVGYETKDLAGESVQDYLTKTFERSPDIKARFTEGFLWSLNELSKSETLEIQLQAKVPGAIVAAPPRRNVPPGTIIKVGKEQDYIAGSVNVCSVHFRLGAKTFNLAPRIRNSIKGEDAVSQLPRISMGALFTSRLKRLGIDQVQFELDNPTVELGDVKAVLELMASLPAVTATPSPAPDSSVTPGPSPIPDLKTCLTGQISPNSYLVVDSVKVASGRYKVFKNNSQVLLSKSEIQQLGLLGEPDPNKEWSLLLNGSYHVAYRLFPWSDLLAIQNPTTKIIASPRQLRPGGTQDIFGLKDVSLLLPYVSQWQVTFLIKEGELTNETSDFSKLKATHNFTALRAEETIRISATSLKGETADLGDEATLETVIQNREGLKNQINYRLPELPPANKEVRIGVGEKICNVDKRHPDFTDQNGESAWMDTFDNGSAPSLNPCSAVTNGERRVKPFESNDHGTHVAGLIGARSNSLIPGLIPSAKLFLIDSTTPASLSTATTIAVERNVHIFNFSFGLDGNDADLRESISVEWKKHLFIVAVDNEGTDITNTATPLISWIADIKNNMIGVGSAIGAAGTQYVLGDWKAADGQLSTGSSYSKKYVHLLAPGHGIYSTTSGNSYAAITGASQAAPQVTAAAAMLFGAGYREPEIIKARLIYTADWFEQLRGKVWGGFLNVRRATWEPDRNLLVTKTEPDKIQAMVLDVDRPNQMTIKPSKFTKFYSSGDDEKFPELIGLEIPFRDILRFTRLTNGYYRVVFVAKDTKQLKILMNADIAGLFPCRGLDEYDGREFESSQCKKFEGVDVTQLIDYVARVPFKVTY